MKQLKIITLFTLALGLSARALWAGPSSNVWTVGPGQDYAGIGQALAALAAQVGSAPFSVSETVLVYGGTYSEAVQVNGLSPSFAHPLYIQAAPGNQPVLDGGSSLAEGIHVLGVPCVYVSGLTLRGYTSNGLHFQDSAGCFAGLNTFQGVSGADLFFDNSPQGQALGNQQDQASPGATGLLAQGSPGLWAQYNSFPGETQGFSLSGSPGSLLSHNQADSSSLAFSLQDSGGCTLDANASGSPGGNRGLQISNSPACLATNNLAWGQNVGVDLEGSSACAVDCNTLWDLGTALVAGQGSTQALVFDNILQGNTALDVDTASQAGFASDYNDLQTSLNILVAWGGSAYSDLYSWQGAAGQDTHSLSQDPSFARSGGSQPRDFALGAASPLSGTGVNLSPLFSQDYFLNGRPAQPAAWDIGFDAVSGSQSTPSSTPTPAPSWTFSMTPTQTPTPLPPQYYSPTVTPSVTATPTRTATPSATPTYAFTPIAPVAGQLTSYPNPYRMSQGGLVTFVFEPSSGVSIDVYDASGYRVAAVPGQDIDERTGFARWNGRNFAGEELPSGLYFAVLRAPGREQETRMTLLR